MTVREHAAAHDAIGELPLVTESATVTGVERMDRDRTAEVRAAVERRLDRRGLTDRYGSLVAGDDWTDLVDALAANDHAGLARRVGALAERRRRPSPMLVRATFRVDEPFDYLAGQYVGLRYGGVSRAYSLASSPDRDEVEVCIRRVPGGKLSPRLCTDLEPGDEVTLRGPHGELVLGEPSPRDLVFLATGTGVAPFKGMIDDVRAGLDAVDGRRRDVWLFLGAAWEDDLPYRSAFRELAAERANVHFVPTLSRERYLADWAGETDYVQHAFLKHVDPGAVTAPADGRIERWLGREPDSGVDARIDPGRAEVYACGINAMVYGLVEAARRVGVPADRIESEGFG